MVTLGLSMTSVVSIMPRNMSSIRSAAGVVSKGVSKVKGVGLGICSSVGAGAELRPGLGRLQVRCSMPHSSPPPPISQAQARTAVAKAVKGLLQLGQRVRGNARGPIVGGRGGAKGPGAQQQVARSRHCATAEHGGPRCRACARAASVIPPCRRRLGGAPSLSLGFNCAARTPLLCCPRAVSVASQSVSPWCSTCCWSAPAGPAGPATGPHSSLQSPHLYTSWARHG